MDTLWTTVNPANLSLGGVCLIIAFLAFKSIRKIQCCGGSGVWFKGTPNTPPVSPAESTDQIANMK